VSRASAGPSSLSGGIMEAMKSLRVINLTPLRSALAYLVNSFSSSASGFYIANQHNVETTRLSTLPNSFRRSHANPPPRRNG
jgi:hypothetical protein